MINIYTTFVPGRTLPMRMIVFAIALAGNVFAGVTAVGPMNVARGQAVSALLPDGTVLIAGGVDEGPPGTTYPAEIYDPHTRAFHLIASTQSPRLGSAAVTLPDGRVLIAAGLRPP